jgi:putative Holliday junction resolvase
MSSSHRRVLAIDHGARRIGVAISRGRVAVPLTVIEHTRRDEDLARIISLAREEHADAIVIGLPLAPDGGEGEQARLARRFGQQIADMTSLPVEYQDERLTSFDAASARVQRRRKPIDDLAATAILQRYLDTARSNA